MGVAVRRRTRLGHEVSDKCDSWLGQWMGNFCLKTPGRTYNKREWFSESERCAF
jgi:hypothetical protein